MMYTYALEIHSSFMSANVFSVRVVLCCNWQSVLFAKEAKCVYLLETFSIPFFLIFIVNHKTIRVWPF